MGIKEECVSWMRMMDECINWMRIMDECVSWMMEEYVSWMMDECASWMGIIEQRQWRQMYLKTVLLTEFVFWVLTW